MKSNIYYLITVITTDGPINLSKVTENGYFSFTDTYCGSLRFRSEESAREYYDRNKSSKGIEAIKSHSRYVSGPVITKTYQCYETVSELR